MWFQNQFVRLKTAKQKLFTKGYSDRFKDIPLKDIIKKSKVCEEIAKQDFNSIHDIGVLSKTVSVIGGFGFISVIYFILVCNYFASLWYHYLFFSISSIALFLYLTDNYLYRRNLKIIKNIPLITEHIMSFYQSSRNMIYALENTIKFFPNAHYLQVMIGALKNDISLDTFPNHWLRTLYTIMSESIKIGSLEEKDPYTESLNIFTLNLMDFRSEQDMTDSILNGFIYFSIFGPPLIILFSNYFNGMMIRDLSLPNAYTSVDLKNIAVILLTAGNLSALSINWIRKVMTI